LLGALAEYTGGWFDTPLGRTILHRKSLVGGMPADQLEAAAAAVVGPPAPVPPSGGAGQLAEAALHLAEVDPARARAQAVRALADASQAGDDLAAAQAEHALGVVARAEYDMAGSAAHLDRAIRLAEHAGAPRLAGEARVSRALALAYCGRIETAHHELDRAAAVLEGADLARVELRRAAIFQFQGRFDEAEEGYGRALPQLTRANDRAALAILHNNRGLVRFQRGSLARADADFRQAITLHRGLGHTAAAAETSQNLGLVAARRGDVIAALAAFDEVDQYSEATHVIDAVGLLDRSDALLAARLLVEARATAERALEEQERRHLSGYLAETRLMLARIALCEGSHAEARQLAERSARAFSRQGRGNYQALAAEVRIRASWLAGERTPALLAASRRAASALERNGFALAAIDARLIAGQVALALGRPVVARAQLARVAVPRRGDPAEVRARAFHARAILSLADGDQHRAEAALRAGMAVIERHRRDLGGTELRAHASAHATDLASLGLRLAGEAGDPARLMRWAERWHAGALSLRPVRPPRDDDLADALAELRELASAPAENADGRLDSPRHHRQAALERRVQQLSRRNGITTRYQQTSATVRDVQETVGEHALVELVDIAGALHAVVLTDRRLTLHSLGATLTATRLVITVRFWMRRLLRQIGSPALLRQAEDAATAAAAELDALLLRPLATRLGDRPLVIVPTRTLHALPWAALPSCGGRPFSVAPSASWWRHAAASRSGTGQRPGRQVLVSGPGVPHGAEEVDQLRALYPDATCLTGAAATATEVARVLDGAALAHVAAHGSFRADQPLLSSLRLADGPLTVYDLERLQAAPRLLILACCDVGLADVLPGDELMGLAASLLAQGTTCLVAPTLPVPDTTTQTAMLAFHRRLRAGDRPADALAAVRLDGSKRLQSLTMAAFTCLGAG
jgi:CHAT domain-containing protein